MVRSLAFMALWPFTQYELFSFRICRVLKKFKNPARKDGLILTHWAQEEKLAPVDQQADASTSQVQLDADKIETGEQAPSRAEEALGES